MTENPCSVSCLEFTWDPSIRSEETHEISKATKFSTKVLDSDDNWILLPYKEAYYIKHLTPSLNNDLKWYYDQIFTPWLS